MTETADRYERLREEISELVTGLDPADLEKSVPATPGWTIRDVIAHLAADATCVVEGDFAPTRFFEAFGEDHAVTTLNDWTARQTAEREGRSVEELLQEWKASSTELTQMMRGEKPWPEGTLPFADRVVTIDAAVHQQDLFGALGIERARDGVMIHKGVRGYVLAMGFRLAAAGIPPLRVQSGDDHYMAGEGEPGATVRAAPFELFRAMSGRRSPEQIAAYDWEGNPEPYIPYFYPYGMRRDALVE